MRSITPTGSNATLKPSPGSTASNEASKPSTRQRHSTERSATSRRARDLGLEVGGPDLGFGFCDADARSARLLDVVVTSAESLPRLVGAVASEEER